MEHDARKHTARAGRRRDDAPAAGRFFGTAPPTNGCPSVWEIHRETRRGNDQFGIYLDGRRIGKERGVAELQELLVGVRLASDEAKRVLAKLKTCPVVYVEVEPSESSECRKPSPESRY